MSNRYFEFRAWRKDINKMVEVVSGIFYEDRMEENKLPTGTLDYDSAFEWQDEIYILMQYTGMKDKNGKLIFEGDILYLGEKYQIVNNTLNEDLIVNYHDGAFCVAHIPLFDIIKHQGHPLEIIGNIFENPEIIKNKL